MKISEIKCRLCGQNAEQVSERGAYLSRVNPKGEVPMVMECRPSCEHNAGGPDDALLRAVKGDGSV